MGCGETNNRHQSEGNCVSRILREIVSAQNDVTNDDDCNVSCERSISDLLGETEPGSGLDTVPVILYCKGTCKPFKGFAVPEGRNHELGRTVASFFFRVKRVTKDNCAILELLISDRDHHHRFENTGENDEREGGHNQHHNQNHHKKDPESPVQQDTRNLEATGLCITVDLECFCHVTCLPAIAALNN